MTQRWPWIRFASRSENPIDFRVEGPQLINGHLLKLLPGIMNIQVRQLG
jgi:hypothetical protein